MKIDVRADLLIKGFWDSYKVWDLHGEASRYRSGCETSRRVVENDTHEDENLISMSSQVLTLNVHYKLTNHSF